MLIVSARGDYSAEQVAEQLTVRGHEYTWLDPADFPQQLSLSASFDAAVDAAWWINGVDDSGAYTLDGVRSVYYRRPGDFTMPDGLSGPELRFARSQARVGVGGVLASLSARWINHPSALADAEYKPRQLVCAASIGLNVPKTLVTNSPDAVRGFVAEVGEAVVKPLAEPILHEAGGCTAVWTRRLTPADMTDLDGVGVTAHLVQAWVDKAHEVRVTAVGNRLFPVAIHAGSAASRVDWRSDYDSLTYQDVDVPADVAAGIRRYLAASDLVYGAFDFVVTPAGEWVFLECNAAGQWGWLAEERDLPIAAALADELATGAAQ